MKHVSAVVIGVGKWFFYKYIASRFFRSIRKITLNLFFSASKTLQEH